MVLYRIDYVDGGGKTRGTRYVHCPSDAKAIEVAHVPLEAGLNFGFEVWRRGQRVHSYPSKAESDAT